MESAVDTWVRIENAFQHPSSQLVKKNGFVGGRDFKERVLPLSQRY